MCSECYQTPCHPRCPNAEYEEQVVCYCDECKTEIYEGEKYYEIHGKIYCECCIDDCKKIAEVD